ncbi:techylectin-like protein [Parasteatoda tepidariorum]|uniref:techylectin-like protein n=1 Tax=Parasteatoda tepidariorum TaxID=114398 RepID=UPI001C71F888|nr:techylectin-5A-like [Parasteatoda tepidariorum]
MGWWLFTCITTWFMLVESCTNSTECDRNIKSKILLNNALDMLTKAKESYIECPAAKPIDCEEILLSGCNESGPYVIWPRSRVTARKSIDVYCDMETDGGGWTVIQRRGNFSRPQDYFYQNWANYKSGFGHIEKDFWLGNDKIFALTNQNLYSVRFELKSVDGESRYALYDKFWIDDEINKYTLHIEDYSGNAGDSMLKVHNNARFSTKDVKNNPGKTHCAQTYKGGWWYNECHTANLNGLYLGGKHKTYADGINWISWKGYYESLDETEIKIRSKTFKKRN